MYNAIVGIDPGLYGGIAVYRTDYRITVIPIPATERNLDTSRLKEWIDQFMHLRMQWPYIIAYIEAVHSMPGQGVSSSFKFGFVTGKLEGIIEAMEIPLKKVTPQAWKKEILAGTQKDKQAAIDHCLSLYPGVNLMASEKSRTYHSGMADAICIAEYGAIKEGLISSISSS